MTSNKILCRLGFDNLFRLEEIVIGGRNTRWRYIPDIRIYSLKDMIPLVYLSVLRNKEKKARFLESENLEV